LIKVIATMASLGKFSKMGFAYGMALCLLWRGDVALSDLFLNWWLVFPTRLVLLRCYVPKSFANQVHDTYMYTRYILKISVRFLWQVVNIESEMRDRFHFTRCIYFTFLILQIKKFRYISKPEPMNYINCLYSCMMLLHQSVIQHNYNN
jgi:hypothetical protein